MTFLFPSPCGKPAGGYKVIFEYANRLASDGYKVNIVYAGTVNWQIKTLRFKITAIFRFFQRKITGFSSNWFAFHPNVKEELPFSLSEYLVPTSDIYVCTTPLTAKCLNEYKNEKSQRFYFIQGYENWGGVSDEQLFETYRYKLKKIAVSNWLKEIVNRQEEECELVPNGFDFSLFNCINSIGERNPYKVAMVYSPISCKGFKYGYEALIEAHNIIPQITVEMFGTDIPDFNLPDWIKFVHCPSIERIKEIYNNASIFVASSIQEGWGLTVGEAMICGAAIVCSDNKGYLEMAENEVTALVSPVCESVSLANNILRLVRDNDLRINIAEAGRKKMKQFSIEASYQRFKEALGLI